MTDPNLEPDRGQVEPLVPAIAALFGPRLRAALYVLSVLVNAGLAPIQAAEASTGGLPVWALTVIATWNALVGMLAVSNTMRAKG